MPLNEHSEYRRPTLVDILQKNEDVEDNDVGLLIWRERWREGGSGEGRREWCGREGGSKEGRKEGRSQNHQGLRAIKFL